MARPNPGADPADPGADPADPGAMEVSQAMHEGGAVARALEGVIHGWPRARTSGHLELDIRDGTRAEAGAVAFYAAAILADHGLGEVTISVRARDVECLLCGCLASPTPADPACDQCGAPLPRRDGPAVTCREMEAASRPPAGAWSEEAGPCA